MHSAGMIPLVPILISLTAASDSGSGCDSSFLERTDLIHDKVHHNAFGVCHFAWSESVTTERYYYC